MLEIEGWMRRYQARMTAQFGQRIKLIGLQGSHARGEAAADSDIDAVLILDKVDMGDLADYRAAADSLPGHELLCGFVAGAGELACWDPADRFQFYFDTKPLVGSLTQLIPVPGPADARRAVLLGACNLYHACSHNFLHARAPDALRALYKAAFFVLQAKYYCETGRYPHSRRALSECVSAADRPVLEQIAGKDGIGEASFDAATALLLAWAGALIRAYGG